MPSSDAYMELSDPAVWGETYDEQFGMGPKGRKLGAFEISSFKFNIHCKEDADDAGGGPKPKQPTTTVTSHKTTSAISEPTIKTFTITKYIDKASPDLFLACLKKNLIKWAIISVRETGEVERKPYLILEFRKLHVTSFDWNLTPGESGESIASMETLEFEFQTMLIKYSRQAGTGIHVPVSMKGWNRQTQNESVSELGPDD